ncbi:MAG: nucleotidyltransferase family protein [Cyanobacteria bacterium P01_F01_bin.150]
MAQKFVDERTETLDQVVDALGVVTNKAQVLDRLQAHLDTLQTFGVRQCGLFGSFVKDVAIHEQSDVDILVAFESEKKTFDNFMGLSFFLEELLGRSVDLVTIESLSPHIGPHILHEVEYVSFNS